jgi:hypothetical protein
MYDAIEPRGKYGIIYSRDPGQIPYPIFFESEEERDEIVQQIRESGLIKVDYHAVPGGRYVMVYKFMVIDGQETYVLEQEEGEQNR